MPPYNFILSDFVRGRLIKYYKGDNFDDKVAPLAVDPIGNSKATGLARIGSRYITLTSQHKLLFNIDDANRRIIITNLVHKSFLYKAMTQKIDLAAILANPEQSPAQ